MRYTQGGGLTDERRAFREKLRMEAAERFARGDESAVVVHDLRVRIRVGAAVAQGLVPSRTESVGFRGADVFTAAQWRVVRGAGAGAGQGSGGARLAGPDLALSRVKPLIGCRFHKSYTVQGVAALLKRHGWSCQMPARQAVEQDRRRWPAG